MATKVNIGMSVHNASYAGFWIRLIALIIDAVVVSILSVITFYIMLAIVTSEAGLNFFVSTMGEDGDFTFGFVVFAILLYVFPMFILPISYFIYYPASKHMGTFGKQILGLIIVDKDGNQISLGKSILRYIGFIIASIILYLGLIMAGFTEKKQGLHDFIAGTIVVYKSTYDPSQGGGGSQGAVPAREIYISDKADKSDPIEELL